jgi:hypothetical protein
VLDVELWNVYLLRVSSDQVSDFIVRVIDLLDLEFVVSVSSESLDMDVVGGCVSRVRLLSAWEDVLFLMVVFGQESRKSDEMLVI